MRLKTLARTGDRPLLLTPTVEQFRLDKPRITRITRIGLGSALASSVGDRALAITNFYGLSTDYADGHRFSFTN
jgi:hypothetical protein